MKAKDLRWRSLAVFLVLVSVTGYGAAQRDPNFQDYAETSCTSTSGHAYAQSNGYARASASMAGSTSSDKPDSGEKDVSGLTVKWASHDVSGTGGSSADAVAEYMHTGALFRSSCQAGAYEDPCASGGPPEQCCDSVHAHAVQHVLCGIEYVAEEVASGSPDLETIVEWVFFLLGNAGDDVDEVLDSTDPVPEDPLGTVCSAEVGHASQTSIGGIFRDPDTGQEWFIGYDFNADAPQLALYEVSDRSAIQLPVESRIKYALPVDPGGLIFTGDIVGYVTGLIPGGGTVCNAAAYRTA